ncbi:hypothetical protein F4703DRAFT_1909546 [Phycomyces blakesleeanus]
MPQEEEEVAKIFACPQCPKIFATRSNLKRHMENPNIHNIPYIRSRDQKRWKGHAKKVVSKEETTERMRKWRAENREKNRQNDLRCRVYRLARQKFGEHDSPEKQSFVRDEITRRLGRRMLIEQKESRQTDDEFWSELPFYSAPQQTIELPSIADMRQPVPVPFHFSRPWASETSPSAYSSTSSLSSSPTLPHLSPSLRSQRRTSSSSVSSVSSLVGESLELLVLPPIHHASYGSSNTVETKDTIKYVEQTKILDEFVGVVLHYADTNQRQQTEPSVI